jgi:hypothetical protein
MCRMNWRETVSGSVDNCREGRAVRTFTSYRLFCVGMELVPPGDVNGVAFGSDDGGARPMAGRLRMRCRGTGGRR